MTRGPVELGKKEQVLNVFIYFQLRFDSFPFHKVENEETNGTGRDGYVRPLFFCKCVSFKRYINASLLTRGSDKFDDIRASRVNFRAQRRQNVSQEKEGKEF